MKINLTVVLLVVTIISLFSLTFLYKENQRLNTENKEKTNAIVLLNQSVEEVKKSNGEILFQNRTLIAGRNTMELLLSNDLKRLKEEFGEIKNIKNYVNSGFKSYGTFYTTIKDSTINDTTKIGIARYSDKWINQKFIIKGDTINCEYTYTDSVEVVTFKTRNWSWYEFIKRKEMKKQGFDKYSYKTSVKFGNPNARATSIKSIMRSEE